MGFFRFVSVNIEKFWPGESLIISLHLIPLNTGTGVVNNMSTGIFIPFSLYL
jgi:hypothetical protein